MVVPVPVVLNQDNVKTLPADVFGRVDRLAAPRLVEYWEQDPCRPVNYPLKFMQSVTAVESLKPEDDNEVAERHGVKIESLAARLRFAWTVRKRGKGTLSNEVSERHDLASQFVFVGTML
jgi:hypothetical protein